jgi:hypothetical protein
MRKNSERFLDAFNTIEHHLRQMTDSSRGIPFRALIHQAGKQDAAVRSNRSHLEEYAELRNAIVHRSIREAIAEPNDRTVQRIESIAALVTQPPALRAFMVRGVDVLQANETAAEALKHLYKQGFSQAPVYDGSKYIGLLTAKTITRWMGKNAAEDIFSLTGTRCREILEFTEDRDHAAFLGVNSTVFEALELYQQYQSRGKHLEAILVTHSGKSSQKLLGLLNVWDLPELYQAIDVPGM